MQIGKINIEKPIVLAPMEDVTDLPFRVICKRLGADIVYTEFVNSEGLIRDSRKTKQKMVFSEEERPFGIQIYGGSEESMESAARLVDEMQPDILDINCGCWVKDVAMRGAGAGLLKDLPRMERIVTQVVKATNLPVTVKTRLGWDESSIQIVDVARMLEQCGVKGLTVHCRTRAQGHKGAPDLTWIPSVKSAVSTPIFVNGGVHSPQDISRVFDETGCDGVMIARGAIDNPWIFMQGKHYLNTGNLLPDATIDDRINLLFQHLKLSVDVKGERKGVIEFRKHYAGYLRGLPNASKLRQELMQFTEVLPVMDRVKSFAQGMNAQPLAEQAAA
ncbi:MAG: tRNA dihydrouridine synthase DusB [Ignavibacteriales bacterium]|nr:tRNA dihydrouridine synthase DusB [Ignavibacteriales bacterium]